MGPGSNSRPLELQSDTHLRLNTLPTALRGLVRYFCLVLLCFQARLFVEALWPPAGKRQTSWLSSVMSYCDVVTFPLVSWVWCGAWLYRFLIFALFLTSIKSLTLNQIVLDFPSWADCIDEPRPDMNIKVTAFTVAHNIYYTNLHHLLYVVCTSSASSCENVQSSRLVWDCVGTYMYQTEGRAT